MNLFSKLLGVCALAIAFTACDKKMELEPVANGDAPKLTVSNVAVAATPADSLRSVLSLKWTDPRYNVNMPTKYVVEIDSVGKNFANPYTREVTSANSIDLLGKELNAWMIGRGWPYNAPVNVEARVISSYNNNNERLVSNVIGIRMTPYITPPKVTPPASGHLWITGGDFGWNNSASMPSQELFKVNDTVYGGVFHLGGGQSFLLLPVAGDWGSKFGGVGAANNSNVPNGDAFKEGGSDLVTPAAAGDYKLTVNFQTGRYDWTPVTYSVPANLYFTGDAFPDGWTNTPSAAQKLDRVNSVVFRKTGVALTPGKYYKFLSTPGAWQPQFGGSSATGGTLGANYGTGSDPDAIPTPAAGGNYTITVNFYNNTYTVQ